MLSITPLPPPAPLRRLDPAGDASRRGLVGGDDVGGVVATDSFSSGPGGTPALKILSGRERREPTYASTIRRSSRSVDGHRVLARRSRPNPRAGVEARTAARRLSLTLRRAGRRDAGSRW
jgi:hypothetical protein